MAATGGSAAATSNFPICVFSAQVPLFDFFTGVFTLFELVVQEERTQVAGVVMVLDCKGFGLSHIR